MKNVENETEDLKMPTLPAEPTLTSVLAQATAHTLELTEQEYVSSHLPDEMMETFEISREKMKLMLVSYETRYINIYTMQLEPLTNLIGRIEMWEWIASCGGQWREDRTLIFESKCAVTMIT